MAVNFTHPHSRAPRQDWSSRTSDLDGSTLDVVGESTADIYGVRTHDVDGAHERDHTADTPAAAAPTAASSVENTRAVTCDLDPPVEQDVPASPAAAPVAAPTNRVQKSEIKAPTIAAGTILRDRYLLERALGAGGTALVFSARDLRATRESKHSRVAIKIPRPDAKDRARAISRIQHEFRHAQNLSHPNIAQVLELDSDEQTWFMTMELIEGKSLASLMRNWPSIPSDTKQAILRTCADALSYAHSRDIVHGDFKPANVLVDAQGRAKVFDFGAASGAPADDARDTRIPAGTPAYASPQVLSGQRPERRDDVFSFACVAYELLTGQHPFERRSSLEARDQGKIPPRAWNLSAPQWLTLLSALSWEREQRPADIESLMESLLAREPEPEIATAAAAAPASEHSTPITNSAATQLSEDLVAPQRGWGFFAFVAIALSIVVFLAQRDRDEVAPAPEDEIATNVEEPAAFDEDLPIASANAASSPLMASLPLPSTPRDPDVLPNTPLSPEASRTTEVSPPPVPARAPAPVSTLSFSDASIVTSESSISAVFVVKRSAPLSGRTSVRWTAKAGTAQPDEDFIASSGTIAFADGQSQRAIYIPLRNDTEVEGDETFFVELSSPQRGRLGEIARAEATIRDDD